MSSYPQQQQGVTYSQGVPLGQQQASPPMYQQQQPQVMVTQPQVIIAGNCPTCQAGHLDEDFTCCGICLAIFFFPIGLICCYMMRQKRCSNCGSTFG